MPLITVMPYIAPRLSQGAIANNDDRIYTVGAHLSVAPNQYLIPNYSRIGKALSVRDGSPLAPIQFSFVRGSALLKTEYKGGFSGTNNTIRAKQRLRFSATLVPKASSILPLNRLAFFEPLLVQNKKHQNIAQSSVLVAAQSLRAIKVFGTVPAMQQTFASTLNVIDATSLSPIISSRTASV